MKQFRLHQDYHLTGLDRVQFEGMSESGLYRVSNVVSSDSEDDESRDQQADAPPDGLTGQYEKKQGNESRRQQ
ncbi:hypothetical protein HWV07_16980 [Natronomonas salina]|uniref:hypothetical protein n=1 Tax=Natronomonas salina TaxID=1710540 RepID=UPI0015B66F5C|nr:hypothetical protein [Natronomonas salina]QLD90641.1 hypothetical protein HWV07_16980 [Natronomonas salina]